MKTIFLRSVATLIIMLFLLPASAEDYDGQQSDSIILKNLKTEEYSNLKSEADQQHEYCENLKKEIDELEYRPIRRNAAYERYKAECMRY